MSSFHLQIVTPDGEFFDGPAQRVRVRTINGDVAILARHIDYAAPLGIGEARVTDENGNTRVGVCNSRLLSVENGVCRVLATTFEWADSIDKERAERSKARAEELLAQKNLDARELELAQARLKRALVRSNVAARAQF